MLSKIKVLNKNVAELISAGEVVERPASIVKELIENSIDAGSTAITVEIKNGGITYLKISDNGCGIDFDEVQTAFLRHATSKVFTSDDLDNIATLGFRGEALASVCAVACVEMFTKTKESEYGCHYVIEGGEEISKQQAGCPDGTTIIIKNLFYNVPARLKFLKKDFAEAAAIAGIIDKIALSYPEISFKLVKEGKIILHTSGNGDALSCIASVFGKDLYTALIPVNYEYNGVKVTGFCSKPSYARSNRTMQHFFINGRYVKTRTCGIALEEAYKNSIMVGKFPASILNIKMPFNQVDVNVHPAKIEVRFINEKSVFDCIYFGIKSALAKSQKLIKNENKHQSSFNFDNENLKQTQGNQIEIENEKIDYIINKIPKDMPEKTNNEQIDNSDYIVSIPKNDFKKTFGEYEINKIDKLKVSDNSANFIYNNQKQPVDEKIETEFKYITSGMNNIENLEKQSSEMNLIIDDKKNDEEIVKTPININLLGEIFKTYIVAQVNDDFIMIDKHALHERILFEKLKSEINNIDKQVLLQPLTLTLTKDEYIQVLENLDNFSKLGFTIEDFGDGSIIIREIPVMLDKANILNVVNEIATNIRNLKNDITPEVLEDLLHSIACRSAIKANDFTSDIELLELIKKVYSDEKLRYCPHGRPIILQKSKKQIEKEFGRS